MHLSLFSLSLLPLFGFLHWSFLRFSQRHECFLKQHSQPLPQLKKRFICSPFSFLTLSEVFFLIFYKPAHSFSLFAASFNWSVSLFSLLFIVFLLLHMHASLNDSGLFHFHFEWGGLPGSVRLPWNWASDFHMWNFKTLLSVFFSSLVGLCRFFR